MRELPLRGCRRRSPCAGAALSSRRGRRLRASGPLLGVLLTPLLLEPAPAGLVLNEILPDPEGADEGREFVEVFNNGVVAEDLGGVCLEFGNGAEGAVWAVRWAGPAGLGLAAGARFLIADRNWQGPQQPDAEVWLGLQNGPDAVRLVRGERVLDTVGYGPLTDPAMLEGQAAPLAPGLALARRPDGRDTDDNAEDFRQTAPTPGAPNFLDWDPRLGEWSVEPPSLDRPGMDLTVQATIVNGGLQAWDPVPAVLACAQDRRQAVLDGLDPGGCATLLWILRVGAAGRFPLRLLIPGPAAGDTLVLALGSVQVGPSALILNEVMAAPGRGQGEWVELLNRGETDLGLADYALADADGPPFALPDARLAAGSFAVIAQDSAALAAWALDNDASGGTGAAPPRPAGWLLQSRSWATLNNGPPAGRSYADRVVLCEVAGAVLDHTTLQAPPPGTDDDLPEDRSWERIAEAPRAAVASNWAFSTAQAGGTPGGANSLAAPAAAGAEFSLRPEVLDAALGAGAVHVLVTVPAGGQGVQVRVFDLWGGLVRDLGTDDLGPGPRTLFWDGRDEAGAPVVAGAYVVLCEILDPQGRLLSAGKACLGVRR